MIAPDADRAGRDVLADQRHCIALARHDEWQGAAPDFTGNNYDLALARLLFGKPPTIDGQALSHETQALLTLARELYGRSPDA